MASAECMSGWGSKNPKTTTFVHVFARLGIGLLHFSLGIGRGFQLLDGLAQAHAAPSNQFYPSAEPYCFSQTCRLSNSPVGVLPMAWMVRVLPSLETVNVVVSTCSPAFVKLAS